MLRETGQEASQAKHSSAPQLPGKGRGSRSIIARDVRSSAERGSPSSLRTNPQLSHASNPTACFVDMVDPLEMCQPWRGIQSCYYVWLGEQGSGAILRENLFWVLIGVLWTPENRNKRRPWRQLWRLAGLESHKGLGQR